MKVYMRQVIINIPYSFEGNIVFIRIKFKLLKEKQKFLDNVLLLTVILLECVFMILYNHNQTKF